MCSEETQGVECRNMDRFLELLKQPPFIVGIIGVCLPQACGRIGVGLA